jgi:hypothetical protein
MAASFGKHWVREGPPVVNVLMGRAMAIYGADRRVLGINKYRADHGP